MTESSTELGSGTNHPEKSRREVPQSAYNGIHFRRIILREVCQKHTVAYDYSMDFPMRLSIWHTMTYGGIHIGLSDRSYLI